MSNSLIGKNGTSIATELNGVPVFTGDAAASPAGVGGVRMFSENDTGAITGTPYLKSPETSLDYRMRVGTDTTLLVDTFNGTAQNTGVWSYTFATMTASQPGGYLQFGTVQGTAAAHGAFVRSWKYFPVFGTAPLALEFSGSSNIAALVANESFYAGLGLPSAANVAPTDGCWFKMNSAGLFGEMQYNGGSVVQVTLSNSQIALATNSRFVMVVGEESVEFWVDDVLYGTLAVPAGYGQPFMSAALPIFMQKLCSGVVSNTNVMRITDVTVSLMDIATNKPWATQQAGAGRHAYQIQNGTAVSGSLSFFTNGTNPTAAAPANTSLVANLPSLLGGVGLATVWNLASTDMLMQSWQNPAGTINTTGRTLIISGVRISAAVATAAWTAPAAGAHLLHWWLAFGHTAVSLATTETASFATATTKAPRRIPLGFMSFATGTAAVGTMPDRGDIVMTFDSPVVVNPGEFIGIACRMLNGAATATGGLYYSIAYVGYFQ